jgi:hypothetical protein
MNGGVMDISFDSLEELYRRIKPALHTKQEEMHRNGYPYIKEEDIWNYLKEIKWVKSKNLLLYEMVSDVLNASNEAIDLYLKEKMNMRNRTVYFKEED